MMLNFGLQFRRRIAIYIAVFVLLLVAFVLILLVELIQQTPGSATITLVLVLLCVSSLREFFPANS